MQFQSLGLDDKLLKAITDTGFTTPTPVQEQSIPAVLEGRDVMACAQTGTGKTAAFVLPTLHRLMQTEPQGFGKGPRVLVITPTRELADQIHSNIQTFSKYTPVSSTMIIGGVAYHTQIQALKKRQDIVIATPGRLIDHMDAERIDFSRVEVVVLDEADRMLDMGFLKPIESIFASINNPVQTLLFSATFDQNIEKVAKRMLKNPVRVHLASSTQNHERITQVLYRANDVSHKNKMLREILSDTSVWQAIIFTATKHNADRLAKQVRQMGHPCGALHGDMRQNARKKVIGQMHKGSLRVLVATDVAARGLDVENLSHVLNYDLPMSAEDYIHRIGRTGRGEKDGIAISFVNGRDMGALKGIERLIGKRLEQQFLKGIDPTAEEQKGALEAAEVEEPRRNGFRDGGGSRGGRSFGVGGRGGFSGDRKPSGNGYGDKNRTPSRSKFAKPQADASPYKGKATPEDLQTATLTTTRRPAKKWGAAPRTERADSRTERSDRPYSRSSKPFGKPAGERTDSRNDRGDRPFSRASKPFGKPAGERTDSRTERSDRPFSKTSKPFGKPTGERSYAKPAGERSFSKPTGDRPFSKSKPKAAGAKPSGSGAKKRGPAPFKFKAKSNKPRPQRQGA